VISIFYEKKDSPRFLSGYIAQFNRNHTTLLKNGDNSPIIDQAVRNNDNFYDFLYADYDLLDGFEVIKRFK
jgi:hypothetical protein